MNYATSPIQTSGQIALPAWRSRVLYVLLLAGLVALLARAVYLQGINNNFLQQKGDARYGRVVDIHAHRGMISDRNGEPLAVSTPVESVWASPADVIISASQITQLAQIVGLSCGGSEEQAQRSPRANSFTSSVSCRLSRRQR